MYALSVCPMSHTVINQWKKDYVLCCRSEDEKEKNKKKLTKEEFLPQWKKDLVLCCRTEIKSCRPKPDSLNPNPKPY